MKILAVCDSPTARTGFGCVSRNLLQHWHAAGHTCSVWGINYNGWPHDYPYKIYPASFSDMGLWCTAPNLERLLKHMLRHDYDVVWLMQDLCNFANNKFDVAFRDVCRARRIRSLLYWPADSTLSLAWHRVVGMVDVPVAYTEYGRSQLPSELRERCQVLPHGVDTSLFRPLPGYRARRNELFESKTPWLREDELLLLNVNQNQPRKAPHLTLALLAALKAGGVAAKLLMHMPPVSVNGDLNLEIIAEQFGLVRQVDWLDSGVLFVGNQGIKDEVYLNQLYNASDVVVSTSLGEGWGLSITEGVAAGCLVAAPAHTSIPEIAEGMFLRSEMRGEQILQLPLSANPIVNRNDLDRVRYGIDVVGAAAALSEAMRRSTKQAWPWERPKLTEAQREWLDWGRIAGEWLKLMEAGR